MTPAELRRMIEAASRDPDAIPRLSEALVGRCVLIVALWEAADKYDAAETALEASARSYPFDEKGHDEKGEVAQVAYENFRAAVRDLREE